MRVGSHHAIIGALYHPPKPIYKTTALLDHIESCLDAIAIQEPGAVVILAGDLNKLPEEDITARTGLVSIVNQPTRGANQLDRIYVSDPCYDSIKVVTSAVKSDHKVVIAYSGIRKVTLHKNKKKLMFRRRSPAQHALLLQHIAGLKLQFDNDSHDVQGKFDQLYDVLVELLNRFYPERRITVTSSDPDFVTADIKALLRRKNRLMRAGRLEEASALAIRIGATIRRRNSVQLRNMNTRTNAREVWAKVRLLTKGSSTGTEAPPGITAEALNIHYASISSDPSYVPSKYKYTCPTLKVHNRITEFEVFHILDHLRPTAIGLDLIPAWFLRLTAPVFSAPIAHMFNQSLNLATVPTQWKSAFISPIPKVSGPVGPADYRPISITPVLSRILEKHVVRTNIYPALLNPPPELNFSDQFAFRPTVSTTAALITLLHIISDMLTTNPFVRVIALDFSKAFDTVRHSTLMDKIATLDISDEAYNWIKSFFDGHSHCTKFDGHTSSTVEILASVIQGSAIGPASYVINAADLKPLHPGNSMVKYADDTYLIIPAVNSDKTQDEINHVETWSYANNLHLNRKKSEEIVITRSATHAKQLPPILHCIPRVHSITVLGVRINDRLSAKEHISKTIEGCSRTLYALRILRSHGLNGRSLEDIYRSTIQAKLMYAAPAWSGFCSAADRNRLDAFLNRSKRYGYCSADTPSISELFDCADEVLFDSVLNNEHHTLHTLLPRSTHVNYNLRPRRHNRELIRKSTYLNDNNFIIRMLFKSSY